MKGRWRGFAEWALSPMIAILFWFTMAIVTMMSLAHGKFFEANFFEIFGAVGQVFFAGAVFLLAKQQFEFTRVVSRRQALIDTYEHRKRLFERYTELRKGLGPTKIDEAAAFALTGLAREMRRLFSPSTIETLDALETAVWDLAEALEAETEARERGEHTAELRKARSAANKLVRQHGAALFKALNAELRIDID